MSSAEESKRATASDHAALEISALRFSYAAEYEVLRELDLRVEAGEKLGVLGPNGAGKTTLFLSTCGVLTPASGDIRVFGIPVTPGRFNPGVGFVFQNADDQLFSPSVRDDVAFGPRNMGLSRTEVDQRVKQALWTTGVAELAERPPHHLSGGEKRMVAVAGVLAMHPSLLIFDEPSAGLDLRARRRLIRFLQASPETLLVASHDLELVHDVCTRVVLIDEGRVLVDGEPAAVMSDTCLMDAHGLETPESLRPPGTAH